MGVVCEQCGDLGFVNALITCFKCGSSVRHCYCFNELPEELSSDDIMWTCEDCLPVPPACSKINPSFRNDGKDSVGVGSSTFHVPEGFDYSMNNKTTIGALWNAVIIQKEVCMHKVSGRPKGLDVAWQHAVPSGCRNQNAQCNYCGKIVKGAGITRLKEHLAHTPSYHVKGCPNVPANIRVAMMESLKRCMKKTDASETGKRPQGRPVDVGWEHASPAGKKSKYDKCNYCRKVIKGSGITGLKQHLACMVAMKHTLDNSTKKVVERKNEPLEKSPKIEEVPENQRAFKAISSPSLSLQYNTRLQNFLVKV